MQTELVSFTFLPTLATSDPTANGELAGGKAKPLKAPKKEKKEVDEDDLAFKEKQKAGSYSQ